MIPKRRKPEKMGLRQEPQIRSDSHLRWIRGFECACMGKPGMICFGKIEAAHARTGTDGGLSVKPSDCWVIPLCSAHHQLQHRVGERDFERLMGINMKAIAEQLWAKSPHRLKLTATAARDAREG